jgi:tetratricopeptide (TPR) repeat protein
LEIASISALIQDKWSHKMRLSRLGIIVLIAFTIITGANCSYYNRIVARKNLVDGATAYKERKFQAAEELFRKTVEIDPNAETMEGETAQLFLARTLHSEYIADRKNTAKGEEAIQAYKKVLAKNVNDQGSFKALASLLDTLGRKDESAQLVNERAANTSVKPEYRAEAFTSMAARQYSCANEISDVEPVKKTVKKDGKDVYEYTKPANPDDFAKLKTCADEGIRLIDQAIALEPAEVQQAKNLDPSTLTPQQIDAKSEILKIFSSAWSYRANLLYQKMRIAEMDGNTAEKDSFKAKGDEARAVFTSINEADKKLEGEKEARKKAAEEKDSNKK